MQDQDDVQAIQTVGTHAMQTRSCLVDYLHTQHQAYEIDRVLKEDVLVVNLKPSETLAAFNSDRLSPLRTPNNCCVFVPKGTQVREKVVADAGNAFYMSFAPDFLQRESCRAFNDRFHEPHIITDLIDPAIGYLGKEIRRFFLNGKLGGEAYLEHLTGAIAVRLLATFAGNRPQQGAESEKLSPAQFARVCDYIDAHLEQELGLSQLTALIPLSQTRFVKCFRNNAGTTPYQYILQRRIERAQQLLTDSNETLVDIAYACGFSSQQHMTQMFTRRLGITPSHYRKEMN